MKFKVFKVTPDEQQTLEYQLEVKDAWGAVDYVLINVPHQVSHAGTHFLPDYDGVHITRYLLLDDKDMWWMIPVRRFEKNPKPIIVGNEK